MRVTGIAKGAIPVLLEPRHRWHRSTSSHPDGMKFVSDEFSTPRDN